MRIVSLVPSLTHLLVDLGLKNQLVGCTKFCVQPADLHRSATLCGGTKDPDLGLIKKLAPTHILVNEEENKPQSIAQLRLIAPVLNTFPKAPADVPAMIRGICEFLGNVDTKRFPEIIAEQIAELSVLARVQKKESYAYFIWKNPWMVAAEDTYISRTLALIGWVNTFKTENRYPEVTLPITPGPALLLFSTEPYPFRKRDLVDVDREWPDHPKVLKIDGMLGSWYGSMTIEALDALKKYCQGEPQQFILSDFYTTD